MHGTKAETEAIQMHIHSKWAVAVIFMSFLIMRGLFAADAVSDRSPDVISVNGNPAVVFDATSYQRDAEGWAPTMDDLLAAEDAVMEVAAEDDRGPFVSGYRQYAGTIEDGERKIAIHSMCKPLEDWDKHFLLVLDGGPCFWQATYNADTGEVEMFYVNGSA